MIQRRQRRGGLEIIEATKARKTKKQAVKRFGEKTALRVKMKLKRFKQLLLITAQTVPLGKIVKRNVNLVLICVTVGNFAKVIYEGH